MMSDLEATMLFHIRAANLPVPEQEYRFRPPRRWRFDLAWPELMLAVELEGGIWVGGRHTTGSGFEKDCEKYNTAAIDGWLVLRFTPGAVRSGEALSVIEGAIAARGNRCD